MSLQIPLFDIPEESVNITITDVPRFNAVKRVLGSKRPDLLTERRLIANYGRLLAYLTALRRNKLTDDCYVGATTHCTSGYAPKDMWLTNNAKTWKDLYAAEIKRRNLVEKYTFWIEI